MLNDWDDSDTATGRIDLLTTRRDLLGDPDTPAAIEALSMLNPGSATMQYFASLIGAIADQGWRDALTALREHADRSDRVNAWLATPDWITSFTYLADHRALLVDPDLPAELAAAGDPVALQHASILMLAGRYQLDYVMRLVTDPSAARDAGFDAAEAADLDLLANLLHANPAAANDRGRFLSALLLAASGQLDRALNAARHDPGLATTTGRRARQITLTKTITGLGDPDAASALERLHEVYGVPDEGADQVGGQSLAEPQDGPD